MNKLSEWFTFNRIIWKAYAIEHSLRLLCHQWMCRNSRWFCVFGVLVRYHCSWFGSYPIVPFWFLQNLNSIWKLHATSNNHAWALSHSLIQIKSNFIPARWHFQEILSEIIIEWTTQYFKSSIDFPQRWFRFMLKYFKHAIHFQLPFVNHIHFYCTE